MLSWGDFLVNRTIKVGASFSGKINTGSYENMNPGFYLEIVDELPNTVDYLEKARELMKEMHDECYRQFQEVAQKATIERIEKEYKNIRFYEKDGKKYPSVTSILDVGGVEFHCSTEDLYEYAAQGQINHLRVEAYIKTGKWLNPIEIEACWPHIHTLKTGKLNLAIDACDFPGFLKKYPINSMENGVKIFNEEHQYAGTPDFYGTPLFKDAECLPTIFDVKRSISKVKNFCQMAAYAKCRTEIQQMGIVPLNDDTEQKFSKPLMSKDIDGYFEMFLNKRREFRKRYGI